MNKPAFTGNEPLRHAIKVSKRTIVMLSTFNSPYTVEPSDNTIQAITQATKAGLFHLEKSSKEAIQRFLAREGTLPIHIIETACLINSQDNTIPTKFQKLWFCLDNTTISRQQASGRKFRTRVSFPTVYVNSDKARAALVESAKVIGSRKTLELATYKPKETVFQNWVSGYTPIPLTVLIKSAELLKADLWGLLDGSELFGKTSRNGRIIFKKEHSSDIQFLVDWIKTDGHLRLKSATIEINQLENAKERLEEIRKVFIHEFHLNEKSAVIVPSKHWGGNTLIISSAPLRQILNLFYEIPLGYKTGSMTNSNMANFTVEEKKRILAAYCESEGCFTKASRKGRISPRFEFKVDDERLKEDCYNLLSDLGYHPTKTKAGVGVYRFAQFIHLSFDVYPFLHSKSREKIAKLLSYPDLLERIFFTSSNLRDLIKRAWKKSGTAPTLTNRINKKLGTQYKPTNIYSWATTSKTPIGTISVCCKICEENIFKFVQSSISILLYYQKIISLNDLQRMRKWKNIKNSVSKLDLNATNS